MNGPQKIGHWSNLKAPNHTDRHQHLLAGHKYKVIREFVDYDEDKHPVGETWTFLGCSFLPYDDGLSLFVTFNGKQEWHLRMQWRKEAQANVLDALSEYIQAL